MDREKTDKTADLLCLLLLVGMLLWFSHEIVWAEKVPFYRDLGAYFYPMRFSLAQSFKAWELPLWDHHIGMGFPLLANFQSGTFYPPHLLFLFLPFFAAIRTLFLFHYLVAATGTYCLCRQWGYPRYLSMIGALLFVLGGPMISLTNLLNHFQAAVWLPWVLLFGERALRLRARTHLLLFALISSVQFLAGSPELYVFSFGLFLLDAWRLKRGEGGFTYRQLFRLFLLTQGMVLGLAMIQVIPTAELFLQSGRLDILPYERATTWSVHPLSLINLFFLDKEVEPALLTGFRLFFIRKIPWITSLYISAVALPAILCWLFNSPLKERVILLGLILTSLIFAMGHHTALYSFLFHYLPFLGLFRFPEKFLFLTFALLFYVVIRGLSWALGTEGPAKGTFLALLLPAMIFLGLYLIFRIERESLIGFISQMGITTENVRDSLKSSSAILVHLERQIALSIGIFLILLPWVRAKLRPVFLYPLLVGLVFFDLASAHQPYQLLLEPNSILKKERVISAPDAEPSRLFYIPRLSYFHPDFYFFNERPFAEKVAAVFSTLIPNTGVIHGFEYLQEMDALGRRPYSLFFDAAHNLPPQRLYKLLGAMNVRSLNSAEALPAGDITLLRHFPEYPLWLYRLERPVPRAYIVAKTFAEKDHGKIVDRLSSEGFNPFLEVILEEPLLLPSEAEFLADAKIVHYTNRRVTIRASLNSPGVLVLADSFYPGWRVYVDGKENKILRANYFFRAVSLAKGEHLVEFRYKPVSFALGLFGSVLTSCGIIGWYFFFPLVRGERRKTSEMKV